MAVFFAVLAVLPVLRRGVVRPWFLAVAIAWVGLALLKPALLHPLNVLWSQIGLLLGRIVNPIVMAILFYGVITPAAMVRHTSPA